MSTRVAIVGGGPGGAASALYLADRGIESTIIEAESFPRFHIGESMTGWVGEQIRNWGLGAAMKANGFPIKKGASVFGASGENEYTVPITARVEGTERRQVETWQVRRAVFDKMLLDTARDRGTRVIKGKALEPVFDEDGRVTGVTVATEDGVETLSCDGLIDASGRKTWLSSLGVAGKRDRGGYENQITVFSHVTGAVRAEGDDEGNTLLFYKDLDMWAWLIPITPEVTSIGITAPVPYYKSKGETKEEFFARETRELNPNLARRLADVELVEPVTATANFSYKISEFTGKGWLCVGDAHRFIDPFFSFGIHLALAEGEKAAMYMERYLNGEADPEDPFAEYAAVCERGMDTVQSLMDSFWANPLGWGYMFHYTDNRGDILDMFGGRIYDEEPLPALVSMRKMVERSPRGAVSV